MTTQHRRNIIREVNCLIKAEVKNYDSLLPGEREVIQDKYIDQVCRNKGYVVAHFYSTDGKLLNKLLEWK